MEAIPLTVRDLTVAYQQQPVLRHVSLEIPDGKLAAIIGPNGAGKSTLIKAIQGLLPTASGSTLIYGKPYHEQRKLVGYVPQRESVDWDFPVNVLDVVLMGRYGHLGWFRRPGRTDRQIALECLEQVGMLPYADRQISQLSGGQQQRVFLARALAQKARLYLMDEPFAGVDAATEKAIIQLLQGLKQERKTVVVVHHDLSTVQEYFDWVIMLNRQVIVSGPADQVFTAANLQQTYGGRLQFLDHSLMLAPEVQQR